jgi:hypothetical protein
MEIKDFKAKGKTFGLLGEAMASVSADVTADGFCEKLEDALDNLLGKLCSGKHFDVMSGNCERRCQEAPAPKLTPCVHVRWGDGANDHLETDDTEILCITVCNPYSNVVLKDFTVQILVLDAGGNMVANLPNGTPSVQIKPQFNVCFGDIPACDPQSERQQSCVSREVVMINRGAIEGKYQVRIFYCFEACFNQFAVTDAITLELVSS